MNNPRTIAIFIEGTDEEIENIQDAAEQIKKMSGEGLGIIFKDLLLTHETVKTAIQLAKSGGDPAQVDLTDAIADAEGGIS